MSPSQRDRVPAGAEAPPEGGLDRAAAILGAFDAAHRELTLAALVARCGLPRSMSLGGGYMLPSREGHQIAAIGLGITMKTNGKSTRDAYSLFEYAIPGNEIRGRMVNSIGTASIRQFGLKRLHLVPPGQMEDIVRGAIGLATEGFFEGVEVGRIVVHPNRTIRRLLADDGQPAAELDDGTRLPADLIVCATGFTQSVPFLPAGVTRRVLDERGNFMLYRQIRPADVPGLYFNGYNSSFFSPLNAEMAAIWIAADLAGAVTLPEPAAMRQQVVEQLAFMDAATDTHHCRGGKIIPFSLHNVDEVLGDLGVNISAAVRAWHWLMPVDPAAYRRIAPAVLRRLPAATARPPVPEAVSGSSPAH